MATIYNEDYTLDTTDLLFQTEVPLTDERNPSHACCASCKQVKPITDFTRKPTKLQFRQWWGELPYEKHKTYVGKECNTCAQHTRRKKNTFDYNSYEQTLRLDPKNHVLVPNRFAGKGTPKKPAPTAEYIPLYAALVWQKRVQGVLRMKNARQADCKNRAEPQYKALILLLRNERNRVKMRVRNGCSAPAAEFCKAYIEHLVWLASDIQRRREVTNEAAKATPNDYVNDDRKETQDAKRAYRRLSSKDAEIVRPRYL